MIRPGAVAGNAPPDHYVPSWWDYLFAGKPAASKALNPVKAAIGVFTPEVDAVENAIQPIGPEANLPPGYFDQQTNAFQNQQNIEGTGARKDSVLIPVTATGPVAGFFPADLDYNGLTLEPRWVDDNGNIVESSATARIAVKINTQDQDWVILSYNIDPSGIGKNDWTSIPTASIRRIWIQVVSITQDATNQPFLVLGLLKGISLGQGGSVGGGASSPSQSSSGATQASAAGAPATGAGSTGGGGGSGSPGGSGGGVFSPPSGSGGPAGAAGGGGSIR